MIPQAQTIKRLSLLKVKLSEILESFSTLYDI